MTTRQGSCHCGKAAFDAEGQPANVLASNCSMCQRKGALLWFVDHDKLRLLTPEGNAGTYLFNKHAIRHRFCPTCGIHLYGEGTDPSGKHCLEGLGLASLPVQHFNGRDA